MAIVRVCDAPMGVGKTSAAIYEMNSNAEKRYLFVTPFLSEVERILNSCQNRGFVAPESKGQGKLSALESQAAQRKCIACTHKLFSMYRKNTEEVLRRNRYTLILDEAFDVMSEVKISPVDLEMLIRSEIIKIADDGRTLECLVEDYDGALRQVVDQVRTGRVFLYGKRCLFWMYPPSMFDAFEEVVILTFMFDSHVFSAYCYQHNFSVSHLWVRHDQDGYRFTDIQHTYQHMANVPNLIKIHDKAKMNMLGDNYYALSTNWYAKNENAAKISTLQKHISNYFKNYCKAKVSTLMWSVYKEPKPKVWGKGNMSGYVVYNSRATNEYKERCHLAYFVNIFPNPNVVSFFRDNGIEIDRDLYALSIMVQWIWRSAIRDGQEISLYLPSGRMRRILQDWLSSL